MKKSLRGLVVTLACLATGTAAWAADPRYSVTPLGGFARATAINNLGDIVGYNSAPRAILLRSGQTVPQQLPSLEDSDTYAYGVNDNLQIVGASRTVKGSLHAFLYSSGLIRDLGTLDGHDQSVATGINSKGQVVGWSQSDTLLTRLGTQLRLPFIYSRGRMTALDALGGLSAWATAINDLGNVVGDAELEECDRVPPTVIRPFYRPSTGGTGGMAGLGGNNGHATAINGNGLVVGSEEPILDDPTTHAVAWFSGWASRPTDLGSLGKRHSVAKGVSKAGQIVGYAYDDGDPQASRVAFLHLNGAMYALDAMLATPGWSIREAIAINDSGQIIADGCNTETKQCGALLLTPITTSKPRRR